MIKSKMQTLLDSAVAKYVANNSRSQDMSKQAKESLQDWVKLVGVPGGSRKSAEQLRLDILRQVRTLMLDGPDEQIARERDLSGQVAAQGDHASCGGRQSSAGGQTGCFRQ